MTIKYRHLMLSLMRAAYLGGLLSIFVIAWVFIYPKAVYYFAGNFLVTFSYLVFLLIFMNIYGGMRVGSQRLGSLVFSCFLAILLSNFIAYMELMLITRGLLPIWGMLGVLVVQFGWSMFCCWVMNRFYYSTRQARQVIAVYRPNPEDEATLHKMRSIHERFKIVGVVDGNLDLKSILLAVEPYESILIGELDDTKRHGLFNYCYSAGKRINIIPTAMDIALNSALQTHIFDTSVLLCRNRELTPEQLLLKRTSDIVFSSLFLILTSPIMLIIAAAIKLQDGGPVFYYQDRLTLNSKHFRICKFRSMSVAAEDEGRPMLAQENDVRITKVGHIIRRMRLDELPQMFNILRGDMSIIGPRPERPEFYEVFTKTLPEFDLRLRMKAGLSGYAQIYGRYNTTPRDKLIMDLFYIENYSILLDVRLTLLTIKILFLRDSTQGFQEGKTPTTEEPEDVQRHA